MSKIVTQNLIQVNGIIVVVLVSIVLMLGFWVANIG